MADGSSEAGSPQELSEAEVGAGVADLFNEVGTIVPDWKETIEGSNLVISGGELLRVYEQEDVELPGNGSYSLRMETNPSGEAELGSVSLSRRRPDQTVTYVYASSGGLDGAKPKIRVIEAEAVTIQGVATTRTKSEEHNIPAALDRAKQVFAEVRPTAQPSTPTTGNP